MKATRPDFIQLPRVHGAFRCDSDQDVSLHRHSMLELVLTVQGELSVAIEGLPGGPCTGGPGTVFVIPPGQAHDQRCQGPWKTCCILLDPSPGLLREEPRTIGLVEDDPARGWCDDLCDLCDLSPADTDRDPAGLAECGGLAFALIQRLRRIDADRDTRPINPRLTAALDHFHDHVHEPLGCAELARVAGTSPSHLRALFQHQFGCGPSHYLREVRLDLACRMLMNPYLGVAAVAERCGFVDANYFSRVFHDSRGMSPRSWRQRQGAGIQDAPGPRTQGTRS